MTTFDNFLHKEVCTCVKIAFTAFIVQAFEIWQRSTITIILWIPYLYSNEGNFRLIKRLTFFSRSDNLLDCIFWHWWLINETKELETHKSQNIRLQWVPLNESLQHITLELGLKLVKDTIKVQYQLLDIFHCNILGIWVTPALVRKLFCLTENIGKNWVFSKFQSKYIWLIVLPEVRH